jgi:sporulation protein YlmC with PRC-barrel domain
MRWSDVQGLKVISRESAEQVGEVRGLVVDPQARTITAVQVTGKKKGEIVSWERFTGLGPDVAVLDDEEAVRAPSGELETAAVHGEADPIGKRLLTDHGDAFGTVQDLEFDRDSGALTALISEREEVGADRLRAIGSYAAVVAAPSDR